KSVATSDRTNLQPIKEPKPAATVDRQDLRSIKNRKSVAKTYQPYLPPIKEHKSGGGSLRFFVVVIIIGILAQIVLPELTSCGNKGRQSEGKQYVGSMNRAQQAKYAEDGAFSNSITALGREIKTETTNYNYSISSTENAAFSYGVARRNNLRSYVGVAWLVPVSKAAKNENTTVSIMCEATSSGKTQPPDPILLNGDFACGDGTVVVSK
ncbi:type IV pilin-like G/H family protein, partial [Microcoleus sp. herbarium13]